VELVRYDTLPKAEADMLAGKVDFVFGDAMALSQGFLKTDKGKAFAFVGPDIRIGSGIGIGVRKGQPDLVANLNRALSAIHSDGTYDKIAAKYFDFSLGEWQSAAGAGRVRRGLLRGQRLLDAARPPDGLGATRLGIVGLVGQAHLDIGPRPFLVRAIRANLEGVEAALAHELEAVDLDVADGADLAREAVALAQDPRGAEGAAIGEAREAQRHQGQAAQPGLYPLDPLPWLEPHPQIARKAVQRPRFGQQTRKRHQDAAILRQGLFVGERAPVIGDEPPGLKQRHRASP
jgi:hypothetical protein